MFFPKTKIKNNKGFTIIEALVVLFIFILVVVSFYSIFSVGMRLIADAKNRLGATAIANEKMEIIRNLDYNDIGTVEGAITGDLIDDEDIIENTRQYHVHTLVLYDDDAFDGEYPTDVIPGDYKKVVITVSWNAGDGRMETVEFSSRFVPNGLEVANSGDGILSINVFSDQPGGTGIPDSSVHVVNTSTGLNTTVETDSEGNVILIGDKIKDSIQQYEITLEKTGHETVNTLPPYPTTSYSPIDVHASVVTGSLNIINIVQNELVNLKVSTSDYLGSSLGDIDFDILGGRKMGYEVDEVSGEVTSNVVYNFESSTKTGSDGEKDFGSVSPGEYTITLPSSITNIYEVIGAYPIDSFNLFSDNDLDFEIKLASKNATSLMMRIFSNETDNPPVSGAEVQLTNSLGYDITQTTGTDGVVFFPTTSDIFSSGDYTFKITANGFDEENSSVTVTESQLKVENVILTKTGS